MFEEVISFIRSLYPGRRHIALHEPCFPGREREYVLEAIDSTFVSSVGKFVEQLETEICRLTGARYGIATVNGTSALHAALLVAGVGPGDEVLTQPLSFVATANAISYCGARPVFLDVDLDTLGLSPAALAEFCRSETAIEGNTCVNKRTDRRIAACVPMHTFGHPCRIDRIAEICQKHHITLVEDAAEAMGSIYQGKHTGTFGTLGIYSFNGNKIVTGGGGGMIVTDDPDLAEQAKHLTTTAKIPHPRQYVHDQVGFNYRLPNLNAALLCAQLEGLPAFLANKRQLAEIYKDFFRQSGTIFIAEPEQAHANYWLNAVLLDDEATRDCFLQETNGAGVMTRPAWRLLSDLDMYGHCQTDDLQTAKSLEKRLVNIPSSVRP